MILYVFMGQVLRTCMKNFMTSFNVGFEGIAGSHSEDALAQLFQSQTAFQGKLQSAVGLTSFQQVCEAVIGKTVDLGILPIENSIAGTFFGVVDLISIYKLQIVGEFEHEERQCLVALPGSSVGDIKEVHSHPYAFDQCRPFLADLQKKLVQSLDTAASCEEIQKGNLKNVGAIASARAASIYGLSVLSEIDTLTVTRYALVSTNAIIPERHLMPRTSLEVVLKNQVGAIMKAVTVFSHRDINISKIESRPSSRSIRLKKAWEYIVYIDVDCGTNDPRMEKALNHLEEIATVKVLGSYPRYQLPPEATVFAYGV
jgi:prephenate dehydratase